MYVQRVALIVAGIGLALRMGGRMGAGVVEARGQHVAANRRRLGALQQRERGSFRADDASTRVWCPPVIPDIHRTSNNSVSTGTRP